MGQLGEIKSPSNSLMGVDLRLMDFVKRNAAKQEVVRVMQSADPENIKPAELRRVRKGGRYVDEPIEINNDRVGTLYTMQGGKTKAYYLPKALTEPFNRHMNVNTAWLSRALYHANTWQKALFTQINPGFWPVAIMRDVLTRYRKMPSPQGKPYRNFAPLGLLMDAAEVLRAFKPAWHSVRGQANEVAENALERGMLISRRESMGYGNTYEGADVDRALKEFDKDPKNFYSKRAGAEKQAARMLRFWLSIGQSFERATKIATMQHLDQHYPELPEYQKRNFVRAHGGSPDFLQRGTAASIIDLFVLFHNPSKESWLSEGDAFAQNKGGYALRGLQTLVPSLAFKYAGLGLLGYTGLQLLSKMMPWLDADEDEVKEMFQSVSQYDMINYDIVPLGWADKEQKKVVYLRLPKDETTWLLMGSLMTPALDGGDVQSVIRYAGGNTPGPNPLLGVLSDWWQFGATGQNPYDAFYQRNVIDPTTFKAGEGTEEMLAHTWNSMGGSIVKLLETGERPSPVKPTKLEQFLDLPVVQNVGGRWLKVSNAGQYQRLRNHEDVREAGQAAAKETLYAREIVDRIVNGETLTEQMLTDMRYNEAISSKVNRYLIDTSQRAAGPEISAVESAQTKAEKEAMIKVMAEE